MADLPTLLSNASTFAQVAVLALLGPERFAAVGVPEEPGTGPQRQRVGQAPGGRRGPTGIPLGAVLDICQAPAGNGVLVGGYHGMWLDAETAYQVPIGREGLATAGARSARGSCCRSATAPAPGRGVPDRQLPSGRVGGPVRSLQARSAHDRPSLAAIVDGSGGIEALDLARRAATTVNGRGACSHPDGPTHFVLSALEVFTEDLAAHVFHSTCGRPVRGMLPLPEGPEQADASSSWWTGCGARGRFCATWCPS